MFPWPMYTISDMICGQAAHNALPAGSSAATFDIQLLAQNDARERADHPILHLACSTRYGAVVGGMIRNLPSDRLTFVSNA